MLLVVLFVVCAALPPYLSASELLKKCLPHHCPRILKNLNPAVFYPHSEMGSGPNLANKVNHQYLQIVPADSVKNLHMNPVLQSGNYYYDAAMERGVHYRSDVIFDTRQKRLALVEGTSLVLYKPDGFPKILTDFPRGKARIIRLASKQFFVLEKNIAGKEREFELFNFYTGDSILATTDLQNSFLHNDHVFNVDATVPKFTVRPKLFSQFDRVWILSDGTFVGYQITAMDQSAIADQVVQGFKVVHINQKQEQTVLVDGTGVGQVFNPVVEVISGIPNILVIGSVAGGVEYYAICHERPE